MKIRDCARPAPALNQANAGFDKAEARNVGNPAHQPYRRDAHRCLVPSSLDRARAVLDEAYQQARRASDSEPMRGWP
jgi:hypothetical protein